jgi:hypothetical protein
MSAAHRARSSSETTWMTHDDRTREQRDDIGPTAEVPQDRSRVAVAEFLARLEDLWEVPVEEIGMAVTFDPDRLA